VVSCGSTPAAETEFSVFALIILGPAGFSVAPTTGALPEHRFAHYAISAKTAVVLDWHAAGASDL
jgi:hypothetical protein